MDFPSEPRGLQVLEEAAQGGCALLASVLKELTLRTAPVPLHQGTENASQGVKCPFTYVPLHTPEQAEECLRRP